jgi:holo-[acyl-carrier protein] synthase
MVQDSLQGCGIDIIEIDRIRESITRHGQHFLDRLFTQREQDYCLKHRDSAPHFAGHFSAKEAVVKALGTGFGEQAHWLEIEIVHDALGKPTIQLSQALQQRFQSPLIMISISHCKEYATAIAIRK